MAFLDWAKLWTFLRQFIRGSPTVSPRIVPAGISAGDVIPLVTKQRRKQEIIHKYIHILLPFSNVSNDIFILG